MNKNVYCSYTVQIILIRFQWNLYFSTDFRKMIKCKFHEIRSVGTELFHAGRQKDRLAKDMNLIVTFRNFAKAT